MMENTVELENVAEDNNESSLLGFDYDAHNESDLFSVGNAGSSIHWSETFPLSGRGLDASPIPLPSEIDHPGSDNVFVNPKTSSLGSGDGGYHRTFSCSSLSSISCEAIVASTPFHKRIIRAIPEAAISENVDTETTVANKTYNVNEQEQTNGQIGSTFSQLNQTYDKNRPMNNRTFIADQNQPVADGTFNMTTSEFVPVTRSDQTFEIAVDRIPEKGPTASTDESVLDLLNTKQDSEVVGEYSTMSGVPSIEGSSSNARSQENVKKNTTRPSLLCDTSSGRSRLKPPVSSQSIKRPSRLLGPKQQSILRASTNANQSSSKPSTESSKIDQIRRKSVVETGNSVKTSTKKLAATTSRKSMLPPPASKLRPTQVAAKKSNLRRSSISTVQASSKQAPSPIDKSRSSKSNKSSTPTSSRNASIATTLHTTSLTTKSSSKLQRNQVPAVHSKSNSSTNLNQSAKKTLSRPQSNKLKPRTSPHPSSSKSSYQSSLCVAALATLLDYVVNKIDGLSAPRLSSEKRSLSLQLTDQITSNTNLNVRCDNLQTDLDESRASHARDVASMSVRYEEKIAELEKSHEIFLKELADELTATKRTVLQQEEEHDKVLRALKEENFNKLEELKTINEERVNRLQQEWLEEKNEVEMEMFKMRSQMDELVENKLQELIKPYVDSYDECKSLQAVIELKNAEQHKLTMEVAQRDDQLAQTRTLQDLVTSLQQKNEDLQTQIKQRNSEFSQIKAEATALQQHLADQQNTNKHLLQRVEELSYRLNTGASSPLSPFNPVFTRSPIRPSLTNYEYPEAFNTSINNTVPVNGNSTMTSPNKNKFSSLNDST